MNEKAERTYKDRVFRDIFSDRKRLLSLYNAVNGSHYDDPDALEVNTLADSIYAGMKNDISFLFYSELSLYEHQSSFNPNMPLRGLMYFARIYEKILTQRNKDIYGSTIVKIPTPRYVIFYNGLKDAEDIVKLRLSDAFEIEEKSGEFEWTATMLNINVGRNVELMRNCPEVRAYSEYVARVRQNHADGMSLDDSVDEAVDWAAKHSFLGNYFLERKAEVKAMSIFEFDQEEYGLNRFRDGVEQGIEQGIEKGIEKGIEQGIERGIEKGTENMIIALDRQGVPLETIAAAAKMSVEQVEEIISRSAVSV